MRRVAGEPWPPPVGDAERKLNEEVDAYVAALAGAAAAAGVFHGFGGGGGMQYAEEEGDEYGEYEE